MTNAEAIERAHALHRRMTSTVVRGDDMAEIVKEILACYHLGQLQKSQLADKIIDVTEPGGARTWLAT